MPLPTKAQIDAVLKFLPALQSDKLPKAKSHGGEDKNGVIKIPWIELPPKVIALIFALEKNNFVVPFDWGKWQKTGREFVSDPKRLRRANLKTLINLLTMHLRKDRFCDGYFAHMVECGHIRAILERLAEIRKSMRR